MLALDKLRSLLNAPIHLLSVYRNETFNDLVGGSATASTSSSAQTTSTRSR